MSESLKEVIARAHGQVATKDLPMDDPNRVWPTYWLPQHEAWMARPESERQWSPEAIDFAAKALAGYFKHPRDKRISPSSMGTVCERELLFGYGNAPKEPFPRSNAEKMSAGEFHHLRWQMEGISAGYAVPPAGIQHAGEVWVYSEAMRCGGSVDLRLLDGSLGELKSTASHLYKGITTGKGSAAGYAAGMKAKHILQIETYFEVDRIGAAERGEPRQFSDWASLLYQDAGDPSQLTEYRLHSSPARAREVHRILEGLHDWIDLDDLPEMLNACVKTIEQVPGDLPTDKETVVFTRCPYRNHCPTASKVMVT